MPCVELLDISTSVHSEPIQQPKDALDAFQGRADSWQPGELLWRF